MFKLEKFFPSRKTKKNTEESTGLSWREMEKMAEDRPREWQGGMPPDIKRHREEEKREMEEELRKINVLFEEILEDIKKSGAEFSYDQFVQICRRFRERPEVKEFERKYRVELTPPSLEENLETGVEKKEKR
jgi:hypothetical protein